MLTQVQQSLYRRRNDRRRNDRGGEPAGGESTGRRKAGGETTGRRIAAAANRLAANRPVTDGKWSADITGYPSIVLIVRALSLSFLPLQNTRRNGKRA